MLTQIVRRKQAESTQHIQVIILLSFSRNSLNTKYKCVIVLKKVLNLDEYRMLKCGKVRQVLIRLLCYHGYRGKYKYNIDALVLKLHIKMACLLSIVINKMGKEFIQYKG